MSNTSGNKYRGTLNIDFLKSIKNTFISVGSGNNGKFFYSQKSNSFLIDFSKLYVFITSYLKEKLKELMF